MRRSLAALLALLIVAVAHRPAATHAATVADLDAALLSVSDVGTGFEEILRRSDDSVTRQLGMPNIVAGFVRRGTLRQPTIEIVAAELVDVGRAEAVSMDDIGLGLAMSLGEGVTVDAVSPAVALGDRTVMYTLSGTIAGLQLSGDCIFWQHQAIIAGTCALGNVNPTSVPYAQKQQARLVNAFGG